MAPLAGRPPFATDEPESFYESAPQPQRRVRQPPPPDPNQRTSAYNLYDNYLDDDKNQVQPPSVNPNRSSGVGALGMGLLNMDGSDSEDEDDNSQRKPINPPGITTGSPSKHIALAAATAPLSPTRPKLSSVQQRQQPQQLPTSQSGQAPQRMRGPPPSSQTQVQPPVMAQTPVQTQQVRGPPPPSLHPGPRHVPQPIAAPRPGYAAPIAALNLARPELTATPAGRMPNPNLPQSHLQNPFDSPHPQSRPPYSMSASPASPAPSTPHPLHPSVTPIMPAFIRPSKSPAPRDGSTINVKFSEGEAIPRKPIIRGNSEETLLPGRGEKGDDFWRRFSMVAKEGNGRPQKESSWLRRTRNGSNRFSRGVWVTAILILILIAGGVALGLFMRRNAPSHQQPKVFGGSADNVATSTTSAKPTAPGAPGAAQATSSSLHVSPTLTLKNREEASPTAVSSKHLRIRRFDKLY